MPCMGECVASVVACYMYTHDALCAAVRLMLEALITFLPTPAEGAVGSLTCSDDQRRKLAREVSLVSMLWVCVLATLTRAITIRGCHAM